MKYNPAFDGIRAIAILLVLLLHTVNRLPIPHSGAGVFVYGLARVGWVGVDLFFVLSGFLITGILLESKKIRGGRYFSAFYARRALRIFPLYFLIVPLTLAGLQLFSQTPPALSDWVVQLTYTQNTLGLYHPSRVSDFLGHTWSLAIEETFYLVWPLCVYFLTRERLLKLAFLGIAAAFGLRLVMVVWGETTAVYLSTPTRIDGLLIGALLALTATSAAARKRWLGLGPPAVLVFMLAGLLNRDLHVHTRFNLTIGFTLVALGSAALVIACTDPESRVTRALRAPLLTRIGKISYGIYLLHMLIMELAAPLLNPYTLHMPYALRYALLFLFCSTLTLVAAQFSFDYFESRLLKLKGRIPYARGAGQQALSEITQPLRTAAPKSEP
jgi:peptidoglycan/LPS O-acetylase OafA/YrhL